MKLLVMVAGLVIVLAAAGGGLAWWALSDDDPFIEADAVNQPCRKLPPITDYDVRVSGEGMEDGKVTKTGGSYIYVSGDSYHTYHPNQGDVEKWDQVYRNGTLYERVEGGPWKVLWEDIRNNLAFPFRPQDLCLGGLDAYTYVGTETVEGKATRKFTTPNLYGEKTNTLPAQGELAKEWDWIFWLDANGYLVQVSHLLVYPRIDGEPHYTAALEFTFSGLGEPNQIPAPTVTPTPHVPMTLEEMREFVIGLDFQTMPEELREGIIEMLRRDGATEEQIRELTAPEE